MGFYDLSKQERISFVIEMHGIILDEIKSKQIKKTIKYFENQDTYIRKSSYISVGRIYFNNPDLKLQIINILDFLLLQENFRIRQTVIYAAGEIGMKDFDSIKHIFEKALFDTHHSPRNAVIGSIKKMCEVNPKPLLNWVLKYIHHPDDEVRREICHGIELRGRKYPQDVLPILKEMQNDKSAKVRKMIIHVIGQISYKKGCLEVVITDLKNWGNKNLVKKALDEIIETHFEYKNFSAMTPEEAKLYITNNYN